MMVDAKPINVDEALKKKVWINSIKEEIEAIKINKTLELTAFPNNKEAISEMDFQDIVEAMWVNCQT